MDSFSEHILRLTTFGKVTMTSLVRAASDQEGEFYLLMQNSSEQLKHILENPDVMLDVVIDEEVQVRVTGHAEVVTSTSTGVLPKSHLMKFLTQESSKFQDETRDVHLVRISPLDSAYMEAKRQETSHFDHIFAPKVLN